MVDAGDCLVAERDALSDRLDLVLDKISQYMKAYTHSQDKLRRSVDFIGEFKAELRQDRSNVAG